LALNPFIAPQLRSKNQLRIGEAQEILSHDSKWPGVFSDLHDPTQSFDRCHKGGVIDAQSLHYCGRFMAVCGELKSLLESLPFATPTFSSDLEHLPKRPALCDTLKKSVNANGDILDGASKELQRLRTERAYARQRFEKTIQTKVNEWHQRGLLQDSFYDVLDGRFVVPLKAERQSELKGNLHSRSQTRQSLFIEPLEFMAANNEMQQLEIAIQAEEARILRDLSQQVGRLAPEYMEWPPVFAKIDMAFAATALMKDWRLSLASPATDTACVYLPGLFHPLLATLSITPVANDLTLGAKGHKHPQALIISGPNTGGKTVFIKAAALAVVMAQAGLPVAAQAEAQVGHYNHVFALIGDEQDMAGGLSSFSAQIKDLNELLQQHNRTGQDFIVIDEILSSTDPEEATALSLALIEELCDRNHNLLITTHFSELANRGRNTAGVAAAAMAFQQGKPTYQIRLHELGSSHALEVAERLHFNERVLNRARSYISKDKIDYDRAKKALLDREAELQRWQQSELIRLQNQSDELTKTLEEERTALARVLSDRISELENKWAALLVETETKLKTYEKQGVASLKKSKQRIFETGQNQIEKAKSDIQLLAEQLKKSKPTKKDNKPQTHRTENTSGLLSPGSQVRIKSLGDALGKIIELNETGGTTQVTVQVGAMRMNLNPESLVPVAPTKTKLSNAVLISIGNALDNAPTPRKLDLRGVRRDEALMRAERYLDQAFSQGIPFVTVITGHGTGAIKDGLKELLSHLPYVKQFGPERSSDDGAFLVEFDV
jgi:DNA mismatch repair protein MutS2